MDTCTDVPSESGGAGGGGGGEGHLECSTAHRSSGLAPFIGQQCGLLGDTYTYAAGWCMQAPGPRLQGCYSHTYGGGRHGGALLLRGGSRVGTASISLFVGTDAVVCWLLRCCKSTDRLRYHHLHLLCTWHLPPRLPACLPLAPPPPPDHARLPPTSPPPRACSCSSYPLERSPCGLWQKSDTIFAVVARPPPPPALRPPPLVTLARVLLALFCCACTTSLA